MKKSSNRMPITDKVIVNLRGSLGRFDNHIIAISFEVIENCIRYVEPGHKAHTENHGLSATIVELDHVFQYHASSVSGTLNLQRGRENVNMQYCQLKRKYSYSKQG